MGTVSGSEKSLPPSLLTNLINLCTVPIGYSDLGYSGRAAYKRPQPQWNLKLLHYINSDRAVYSDLNPRDGGQSLYPMCTEVIFKGYLGHRLICKPKKVIP